MSDRNARMADLALAQVGKPYVWATAGPDTFDCSGLVWWCYNQVADQPAAHEYRDSHLQADWGEPVPSGSHARGDLVFWDTQNGAEQRLNNPWSHVGIVLDRLQFVHAANPGDGVIVSYLDEYDGHYRPGPVRRLFPSVPAPEYPTRDEVLVPAPPIERPPYDRWPTGQPVTPNPWNGGTFDTTWEMVTRWVHHLRRAGAGGATAIRLLAHCMIESQGVPAAIQRNPENGDSFGLWQIVPRWHRALISQTAGIHFNDDEAAGKALIRDPQLSADVAVILMRHKIAEYGSADMASSYYFTGKTDWTGHDLVNMTRAFRYRASLYGLMAELQGASDHA